MLKKKDLYKNLRHIIREALDELFETWPNQANPIQEPLDKLSLRPMSPNKVLPKDAKYFNNNIERDLHQVKDFGGGLKKVKTNTAISGALGETDDKEPEETDESYNALLAKYNVVDGVTNKLPKLGIDPKINYLNQIDGISGEDVYPDGELNTIKQGTKDSPTMASPVPGYYEEGEKS